MTTTNLGDRVRLAELIAELSLASDLAIGEPMEHALRRCLIATRLGQAVGCTGEVLSTIYDLALLRSVGCTAEQHENNRRFGNEQPVAYRPLPRRAVVQPPLAPVRGGRFMLPRRCVHSPVFATLREQ